MNISISSGFNVQEIRFAIRVELKIILYMILTEMTLLITKGFLSKWKWLAGLSLKSLLLLSAFLLEVHWVFYLSHCHKKLAG